MTFYATSCFVSTNLAKEAGKLTNWKGKFWASPATDPYSGGPKLLIYKLFQKGRVLAQDGVEKKIRRHLARARLRPHAKSSLRVLAFRSRSIVVYLWPCIDPFGASPKAIGPTGLAFFEKTSLYFPLSPYGSIRLTGA